MTDACFARLTASLSPTAEATLACFNPITNFKMAIPEKLRRELERLLKGAEA